MTPTIAEMNSRILLQLVEDYEALKAIGYRVLDVDNLEDDVIVRAELRAVLNRVALREGRVADAFGPAWLRSKAQGVA